MRKTTTIFLLLFSFAFSTTAQTTNCDLVAGFNSTLTSFNSWHFQNTTLNLSSTDSIRWTFGDGTSSSQASPDHSFPVAGSYNVCLRVQKRNAAGVVSNCVSEFCSLLVVSHNTPDCNLTASFTVSSTSANTYTFQNTSTNITSTDLVQWNFGDGSTSTQLNPTHTYAQPGNYNVCLRVQKRNAAGVLYNCVREFCHLIVIIQNTPNCDLVAGFTTTTITENTFQFQNTTTQFSSHDSVRWTFGDGTSSYEANPIHTYTSPGTYHVCLRVQKRSSAGVITNCVREICHTVIVTHTTTSCAIVAAFNAAVTTGNTYQFQNLSTGLTNNDLIQWTFGDGTSSNQASPLHTFTLPGNYNVCLRIQKRNSAGVLTNCVREVCHIIMVAHNSPNCDLVAGFTTTLTGTNTYHFQNTTVGLSNTDSIRWTFGDGTTSSEVSPSHTYAQAGNYNVCIRIQRRNNAGVLSNCVRELCHMISPTSTISCAAPYPNPTSNNITVPVSLIQNEMMHVYIYNSSNALLKSNHQQGYTGVNLFTVYVGDLLPGIYAMKVVHENVVCVTSFVKL